MLGRIMVCSQYLSAEHISASKRMPEQSRERGAIGQPNSTPWEQKSQAR